MELIDVVFRAIGVLLGLPLRLFRRWLDRQPHRDGAQISTLQKLGRLALGVLFILRGYSEVTQPPGASQR
jgi:hypothetical protein